MRTIFLSAEGGLKPLDAPEPGCWINLTNPTAEELQATAEACGVPSDFLEDPLDMDERARLETEDEVMLLVLRVPRRQADESGAPFTTAPIGVIITPTVLITVSRFGGGILEKLLEGRSRRVNTQDRYRAAILILERASISYLAYLKELNQMTSRYEEGLQKSMRNQELINLLNVEKSLVYFITSLKANDLIMDKLLHSKTARLTEDDRDHLEDAMVENRQALEMTEIHSQILGGLMDAFASVISNNMNAVMKLLTGVTIILMVPNLIASLYGMNVKMPLQDSPDAFAILVASMAGLTIGALYLFIRKRWL